MVPIATVPANAAKASPQDRCVATYRRIDDALDDDLRNGRQEQVLAATTEGLAQCDKDLGRENVETARMLRLHARAERANSKYDDATAHGQEALTVLERELGPSNLDVAEALDIMAGAAVMTHRYERTIELSERALKIRETHDDTAKNLATTLSRLAAAHTKLSHKEPAIAAAKRALDVISAKYSEQSEEVGGELGSLGKVYYYFHDYDQAEPLLVKALDIVEKSSPDTDVLASKSNDLAVLYHYGRTDLERAEPLYRRAVALHEKLVPNSMNTAQGWINLGTLLCQKGNLTEGRPLYDRGMARMKELAGRETPEMGWARDYFKAHVK